METEVDGIWSIVPEELGHSTSGTDFEHSVGKGLLDA